MRNTTCCQPMPHLPTPSIVFSHRQEVLRKHMKSSLKKKKDPVSLQCVRKPLPYILLTVDSKDYFFSGRNCLLIFLLLSSWPTLACFTFVMIDLKLCEAGPLFFFHATKPCHYKETIMPLLFLRCISLTWYSATHTFLNKSTKISSQSTTFLPWKLLKDVNYVT